MMLRRGPSALIDIGVNLTDRSYANPSLLAAVLARAVDANVHAMLLTGTSIKSSREAIKLVRAWSGVEFAVPPSPSLAMAPELLTEIDGPVSKRKYPQLACTVGVHPHDAARAFKTPTWLEQLTALIHENSDIVRAVGECGLDYDRMFSPAEIQRKVFRSQLELARQLKLPVFLHCRAAFEDFRDAIQGFDDVVKILHCFTEADEANLRTLIDMGLYFGITGWVADERRGTDLAQILPIIPLDRLMIETDCPYLLPRNITKGVPPPKAKNTPKDPNGLSKSRNEPCHVSWVLLKVAQCYGLGEEEVARQTTETASRLFAFTKEA